MTVVLDTSAILALSDRADPGHRLLSNRLRDERGAPIVPAGILGEAGYMLDVALGGSALDRFLADLEAHELLLDCGEEDVTRIRELVERYADLPLGFADAAVTACAERRKATVLTLDRRDFDVVAADVGIHIAP